jgi:hypothetical protein
MYIHPSPVPNVTGHILRFKMKSENTVPTVNPEKLKLRQSQAGLQIKHTQNLFLKYISLGFYQNIMICELKCSKPKIF